MRCASASFSESALTLDFERECVGGLSIVRVELQCPPPVPGGLGKIPPAALGECLQPLDGGAVGGERRRPRQLLGTLLQLLLAEQQHAEIRETGRLPGRQPDDLVELLPRQHLLRRLHRREADVERRHDLAVHVRSELGFAFRRARERDGRDRE